MKQTLTEALATAHAVTNQASLMRDVSIAVVFVAILIVVVWAVLAMRLVAKAQAEASYLRGKLDERDEQKAAKWVVKTLEVAS